MYSSARSVERSPISRNRLESPFLRQFLTSPHGVALLDNPVMSDRNDEPSLEILINATPVIFGGGITVAIQLVRAMARLAPHHHFIFFCTHSEIAAAEYPNNVELISLPEHTSWTSLSLGTENSAGRGDPSQSRRRVQFWRLLFVCQPNPRGGRLAKPQCFYGVDGQQTRTRDRLQLGPASDSISFNSEGKA